MTLPSVDLDFTEQPPIPEAGIARANELMRSGRLFRYGEAGSEELDVAQLEHKFAELTGARFCVALNSCGASLAVALRASGVRPGGEVLMNAFTLAPVPGAIDHVGGRPIFVGITPDFLIDLDDLRRAAQTSTARHLLLSHMRGHIANMDEVVAAADELQLIVIEDCAHTMGASWNGTRTGRFGAIGCFSSQTFKHVNSGEGGLLITDDEDLAARAVLLSGSYMLYEQHGAAPTTEVFERQRLDQPNLSMRMSALAAAVVTPQLELLEERTEIWNERYTRLEQALNADPRLSVPTRDPREQYVASSIQFTVSGLDPDEIESWVGRCVEHGVFIKWFGRPEPLGFTSRFDHWRFADEQHLAATQSVLTGLCDMRIPLSMTVVQTEQIATVIIGALP